MTAGNALRLRLREATAEIHGRLHSHPGLGAAASGAMALADYRLLLARLWGFHKAFEEVLGEVAQSVSLDIDMTARARAPMLEADLLAMGLSPAEVGRLNRCDDIFRPQDAAAFMGALYVVEGSTLGGVQIARALSPLFGGSEGEGRKFFLGYGDRHSAMWRGFLEQLDAFAGDDAREASAIDGAIRTFADFEVWMDGWRREAV